MGNTNHRLDAVFKGTGDFLFCEGAKTLAEARLNGFRSIENINVFEIKPATEILEHEGSYEGVRIIDKSAATKLNITYMITADEIEKNLLSRLLLSSKAATDFTQSAIVTATAVDTIAFTNTTSSVVGKWYEITSGGVRLRNITTLSLETPDNTLTPPDSDSNPDVLVEGADYELNKDLGCVRFLKSFSVTVTPKVVVPAIAAGSYSLLSPLTQGRFVGFGVMRMYDDYTKTSPSDNKSNLYLEHANFACTVTVDGSLKGEGNKYADLQLKVQVLGGYPGTVWQRDPA